MTWRSVWHSLVAQRLGHGILVLLLGGFWRRKDFSSGSQLRQSYNPLTFILLLYLLPSSCPLFFPGFGRLYLGLP